MGYLTVPKYVVKFVIYFRKSIFGINRRKYTKLFQSKTVPLYSGNVYIFNVENFKQWVLF